MNLVFWSLLFVNLTILKSSLVSNTYAFRDDEEGKTNVQFSPLVMNDHHDLMYYNADTAKIETEPRAWYSLYL